MFGAKNGKRVEPRRSTTSKQKHKNKSSTCCNCRSRLANCCNHGWFVTLFCGFLLVSSLPRILIILDFIITFSLYLDYNRKMKYLRYTFEESTFDIVILSFFRCIILFICFAYRFQREGSMKTFYFSLFTVISTSIYLVIKLYFNISDICLFSLTFVWIECIFFFMVRRRRIRYAANQNIKTSPSKYLRFEDNHNHNENSHKMYKNETPPPSAFINDKYLDNLIHAERENSNLPNIIVSEANKLQSAPQNDESIFDEKFNSMEHSISYPPLSEFSAEELSLRTQSSDFMNIDGIAIHYCFERNFNDNIANNDNIPYIVLLHGFGGGVFSWKQSINLILSNLNDSIRGILAFDRVGFGLSERPLMNESDHENLSNYKNENNNPYSMNFSMKILKTFLDKFEMSNVVIIGHSTGCLVANWFTFHYPQYIKALILISPTHGMPAFIRSILNTKLGKPIILSLIRSEIGQVTLYRAWHKPNDVSPEIVHAYKQVLKLKNWNESLLQMSRTSGSYSNMEKYHECLAMIECPVWFLHGDDDKLVTFRESVLLSQYYKYSFDPIKLRHCGHIPHQEIPNEFVEIVQDIICKKLIEFEQREVSLSSDEHNENESESVDVATQILNKGKEKIKQMMKSIQIIHIGSNKKNEDGLIQNEVSNATNLNKMTQNNQPKVTESSALLPD